MSAWVPRSLQAVLFDLGSTLIYFGDDWQAVQAAGNRKLLQALRSAGLALEETRFLAAWQSALSTYQQEREITLVESGTNQVLAGALNELGYPDTPQIVLRQALSALYAVSQEHWRTELDAGAALEQLKRSGLRLGVLSNAADNNDVQRLVDQTGLRPLFDFVLSSAALGVRKPDRRAFQAALQAWGLPGEKAVMVGDQLHADIYGAHQVGMGGIWITRQTGVEPQRTSLELAAPEAVIGSLSELPRVLERLEFPKE